MKNIFCCVFLLIIFITCVNIYAQPGPVRETNTPIVLHYADILKDYIAFIKPHLDAKNDLVMLSKKYFDRLAYRVVKISITTTVPPKINQSWKLPHSKMAVLPRMVCYVNKDGAMVSLYDQGDDYVLIQNFTGQVSSDPGLFVSVGVTHQWK